VTGPRATSTRRVKALSALRAEADDRVGSKADILGSMIGLKVRAGVLTGAVGITYFVREKVPKRDLAPKRRVPTRMRVGQTDVVTDVLEWPQMAEQALPEGSIIFDGRLQGTLSCFAVSQAGAFGLSCAHCLVGADGNPSTPTAVATFSKLLGRFVPAGQSVFMNFSPGTGLPGNFGYLDCGLFDLRDPTLVSRASNGQPLPFLDDIHALVGRRLLGVSPLNAPSPTGFVREAQAIGVEANALGELCDVVLQVQPPGTFRGDSGVLWITEDGRAAAIHARGEVMPELQGSRLATGMSARRACTSLGVQLVLG
jgi:hypothetical protein